MSDLTGDARSDLDERPPGLGERSVAVWRMDLDCPWPGDFREESFLTPEERARAERYLRAIDGARFRRCRAWLRMGLSWYSGIPPGEIVLSGGARGKPYVTTPQGLHFNVSHSEGMGLVAFTRVGEVGIDVEAIDRRVDALEVASAYFSRTELAMVAELAGAAQVERFLRIWTRKEAVLKAAGTGVAGGVDRVDGSRDGVVVHLAEPGEPPTDWLIRDLAMPEGYVAAIATRPGEWDIEVWPNGRQVLPEILRKHFAGFE